MKMNLKNSLLPHQARAVEKLKKYKVGALFMEQGTGKTITALELCRIKMQAGHIEKIIWLCPCSAKESVEEEITKQAPREMLPHFVICGIETLSTSVKANAYLYQIVKTNECGLVIDESLLIKNHRALRTKNTIRIAKFAKYKLILNGTPTSKDERDLYSQFYALDWRILGYQTYWSFEAHHIAYDDNIPDKVVEILNIDYLIKRIEPYTFKITKDECLNLPPKRYHTVSFYITKEQEEHYDYVAGELLFQVDEYKAETIYQLFSALQAVVSGKRVIITQNERQTRAFFETEPFFEKVEENPRLQKFLDIIDNTKKTIIFCHYTDEVEVVVEELNKKYGSNAAVRFDGKISNRDRQENRKLFKSSATFLVANLRCAGHSLNLQFCNQIIYYSNDWDLAPRLQSEDRVHRIGQEKDVEIVDLCAIDTLDDRIKKCLERKESLLESLKNKLGKDNKEVLREFFLTKQYAKKRKRHPIIYDYSNLEEENAKNI